MSVKRRLAFYSGQRVDIPHLRALESAVSHDFDMLLRGMMTGLGNPYLVRGFEIKIPNAAINATALQVTVADSVLLHSTATESGTILQTESNAPDETLNAQNARVIGSFQANALNYISLDYRRTTDVNTIDQTAGWSPSQQLEFQRTAPIGRLLDYKFIITTSGFSTNLPLYIVKTSSTNAVEYITKAVDGFFRLGKGGANPDPSYSFAFGNYTNTQTGANPRREWIGDIPNANPMSAAPGSPTLAFNYGDWSIRNLKEWMDAMMTRIKEITGSEYWYIGSGLPGGSSGGDEINLTDLYFDSIGSVMTGIGELSYNLVLETSQPTDGAYQALATDSTIQPGDVYVEGVTSGTKATVTAFNASRLLINSLTNAGFVYGEELRERRFFRPNAANWKMIDYTRNALRYAAFSRITTSVAALPNNISSWSYSNITGATSTVAWSFVTINTSSPHGLTIGEKARVAGLLTSGTNPPNGVHRILDVPTATSLVFAVNELITGTASVSGTNGAVVDTDLAHPYSAVQAITDFQPGTGTTGDLTIPNHSYLAPQSLTGDFASGSRLISSVNDVSNLKLGMKVYSANFAAGFAYILSINTTTSQLEMSANSTATATGAVFIAKQAIFVTGLQATGYLSNDLDGIYDVEAIGSSLEVNIDFGFAVTGTAVASDATSELIYHDYLMTVTGANPAQYDITNQQSFAIAGDKIQFLVGDDILPPLGLASGPIEMDGVVAVSEVTDPVRVASITNDGAGNLTVTTYVAHEQVTAGPVDFTIFGNSSLSEYIRSYTGVTVNVISPTVFELLGTGVISVSSYTNGGSDNTFVRFADNPYAGPIQWSSDIVVKGVIGDLAFKVLQTAVVDTSDPDVSPNANQFNVNGQTGTAYLQDGEVLFVKLKRNKPISNNTVFTTAGGNAIIATSSIMVDENGDPLIVGDFIKFAGEADSFWLRIASINATTVTLTTDRNQPPSVAQRPAKSGKMVYARGTYDKVYVKKHWLVDASASTYWLGVRRDNDGTTSKIYFRSMEVEAGEVRQINDNTTSNQLQYIGATSEGEINPNYSAKGTGDQAFSVDLSIDTVDNLTRAVTFDDAPSGGFQSRDRIVYYDGSSYHYFTVKFPLSTKTVIVEQATTVLATGQEVSYYRENKFIEDQDNLTIGIRKQDRQAGHVDTALHRPIYDESLDVVQINLSGSGTVRSGSYVYKGPINNPTALAWVIHGNVAVVETIEGIGVTMPGGHSTVGASAILAGIVFGSFQNGDGLSQNGALTGRTVNNPGNPPFTAPTIYGDSVGGGVELVLPPNRRTQIKSVSGYTSFGNHSVYSQSAEADLTGEELFIVINDTVREARYDYDETFGGPKAKIRLRKTIAPFTHIRFRLLGAFGSAVVATSGDVSLQGAYNSGATIQTIGGRPVEITSDDTLNGSAGLINRGSIHINGGANQLGGIFNETGDQGFVIGKEADKPKEVWAGTDAVKTHSSHAGSANVRKTAAQTVTTDVGTVITNSAITLADNVAYRIKMSATARRSDGTFGVASFTLEGTFYRSGGTAQVAGSPINTMNGSDGDGVAYAAAFGLSGNDVVLVVYGTTGATIQWAVTMDFQAVGVA